MADSITWIEEPPQNQHSTIVESSPESNTTIIETALFTVTAPTDNRDDQASVSEYSGDVNVGMQFDPFIHIHRHPSDVAGSTVSEPIRDDDLESTSTILTTATEDPRIYRETDRKNEELGLEQQTNKLDSVSTSQGTIVEKFDDDLSLRSTDVTKDGQKGEANEFNREFQEDWQNAKTIGVKIDAPKENESSHEWPETGEDLMQIEQFKSYPPQNPENKYAPQISFITMNNNNDDKVEEKTEFGTLACEFKRKEDEGSQINVEQFKSYPPQNPDHENAPQISAISWNNSKSQNEDNKIESTSNKEVDVQQPRADNLEQKIEFETLACELKKKEDSELNDQQIQQFKNDSPQVDIPQIDVINSSTNDEKVESSSINGQNQKVESSSINGQNEEIKNLSINGQNEEIKNLSINDEKVESSSINGQNEEIKNLSINDEKVESSSINGQNEEIKNLSINDEKGESSSINSQNEKGENSSVNGQNADAINSSINGQNEKVENFSINGQNGDAIKSSINNADAINSSINTDAVNSSINADAVNSSINKNAINSSINNVKVEEHSKPAERRVNFSENLVKRYPESPLVSKTFGDDASLLKNDVKEEKPEPVEISESKPLKSSLSNIIHDDISESKPLKSSLGNMIHEYDRFEIDGPRASDRKEYAYLKESLDSDLRNDDFKGTSSVNENVELNEISTVPKDEIELIKEHKKEDEATKSKLQDEENTQVIEQSNLGVSDVDIEKNTQNGSEKPLEQELSNVSEVEKSTQNGSEKPIELESSNIVEKDGITKNDDEKPLELESSNIVEKDGITKNYDEKPLELESINKENEVISQNSDEKESLLNKPENSSLELKSTEIKTNDDLKGDVELSNEKSSNLETSINNEEKSSQNDVKEVNGGVESSNEKSSNLENSVNNEEKISKNDVKIENSSTDEKLENSTVNRPQSNLSIEPNDSNPENFKKSSDVVEDLQKSNQKEEQIQPLTSIEPTTNSSKQHDSVKDNNSTDKPISSLEKASNDQTNLEEKVESPTTKLEQSSNLGSEEKIKSPTTKLEQPSNLISEEKVESPTIKLEQPSNLASAENPQSILTSSEPKPIEEKPRESLVSLLFEKPKIDDTQWITPDSEFKPKNKSQEESKIDNNSKEESKNDNGSKEEPKIDNDSKEEEIKPKIEETVQSSNLKNDESDEVKNVESKPEEKTVKFDTSTNQQPSTSNNNEEKKDELASSQNENEVTPRKPREEDNDRDVNAELDAYGQRLIQNTREALAMVDKLCQDTLERQERRQRHRSGGPLSAQPGDNLIDQQRMNRPPIVEFDDLEVEVFRVNSEMLEEPKSCVLLPDAKLLILDTKLGLTLMDLQTKETKRCAPVDDWRDVECACYMKKHNQILLVYEQKVDDNFHKYLARFDLDLKMLTKCEAPKYILEMVVVSCRVCYIDETDCIYLAVNTPNNAFIYELNAECRWTEVYNMRGKQIADIGKLAAVGPVTELLIVESTKRHILLLGIYNSALAERALIAFCSEPAALCVDEHDNLIVFDRATNLVGVHSRLNFERIRDLVVVGRANCSLSAQNGYLALLNQQRKELRICKY